MCKMTTSAATAEACTFPSPTASLDSAAGIHGSDSCSLGSAVEDDISLKSDEGNPSRMKMMCSYGGTILPRPHDNHQVLRYVGGETRIVVVSRNVSFKLLMAKLAKLAGKNITFKYQLPNEDLDALISVKSDEDVRNMMDEFEKLEAKDPSFKLRAFLFRPKPNSCGSLSASSFDYSSESGSPSSSPPKTVVSAVAHLNHHHQYHPPATVSAIISPKSKFARQVGVVTSCSSSATSSSSISDPYYIIPNAPVRLQPKSPYLGSLKAYYGGATVTGDPLHHHDSHHHHHQQQQQQQQQLHHYPQLAYSNKDVLLQHQQQQQQILPGYHQHNCNIHHQCQCHNYQVSALPRPHYRLQHQQQQQQHHSSTRMTMMNNQPNPFIVNN